MIHALAVSVNYLAISSGYEVYLYKEPFSENSTLDRPITILNSPDAEPGYEYFLANPVAVRLEFIENRTLLVGYLAGIRYVFI